MSRELAKADNPFRSLGLDEASIVAVKALHSWCSDGLAMGEMMMLKRECDQTISLTKNSDEALECLPCVVSKRHSCARFMPDAEQGCKTFTSLTA